MTSLFHWLCCIGKWRQTGLAHHQVIELRLILDVMPEISWVIEVHPNSQKNVHSRGDKKDFEMSFFFGTTVKKANPTKVFVPQNKPKSQLSETGSTSTSAAHPSTPQKQPKARSVSESSQQCPPSETMMSLLDSPSVGGSRFATNVDNVPMIGAESASRLRHPASSSSSSRDARTDAVSNHDLLSIAVAGSLYSHSTQQPSSFQATEPHDSALSPSRKRARVTNPSTTEDSTAIAASKRRRRGARKSKLDTTTPIPEVKSRPVFPLRYGINPPNAHYSKYTLFVRLPTGDGLSGIEGLTLANMDERAVVDTIFDITLFPPQVQRYLQQIDVYDVIVAVNNVDARYASFQQVLRALTRTQPNNDQSTGTGANGAMNNASRGSLRNSVVDTTACVVFARPPPDVVERLQEEDSHLRLAVPSPEPLLSSHMSAVFA